MRPERSLTACLNGSRRPDEHPAVPLAPDEVARAASDAVAAGATDVHVHPRDASGRESLAAEDVGSCVAAIRAAVPGVRVGVTTLAPAGTDREALVRSWRVLPDAVSVNWHEPGAEPLARCLLERGVDVEAGLWQPVLRRAAELGLQLRIGLEDVLLGPGGLPATDNAALVQAALEPLGR